MRIYHVVSKFPPSLGGMQKVALNLAEKQAKNNDVKVITSNQGARSKGKSGYNYKFEVLRLRSIDIAHTPVIPMLVFNLFRIPKNSIVHLHVAQAFVPEITALVCRVRKIPYVVQLHIDVEPSGPAGFLLKIYKPLILKKVLRNADKVAVFTQDQKKKIKQMHALDESKVVIIPNGVEGTYYFNGERVISGKPKLLFVGRLEVQKNVGYLLTSLTEISKNFETIIIGDGRLGEQLESKARKLRLSNVKFAGRQDGKELINSFEQANIFVLPSVQEGMPLALLEAMAMSLPIVATNVTGNRDLVQDGVNGLLVDVNKPQEMADALEKLRTDKKLYKSMSANSRKLAENYSWDKVAAQFEKLYEELHA